MGKEDEFSLIVGQLYKMGLDEILHRYVLEHERQIIPVEAHGGTTSGHYARKVTIHKILRGGLWWPTLHKDLKEYFIACDVCQIIGKPSIRDEIPLVP